MQNLRIQPRCYSIQIPSYIYILLFILIGLPYGKVAPMISSNISIIRTNLSQWQELVYLKTKKSDISFANEYMLKYKQHKDTGTDLSENAKDMKKNTHIVFLNTIHSYLYDLLRTRRQILDGDMVDKCRLFVEGEIGKNEIYSPDYPNNYPKNINCTRIITAPQGQIIRLDFRNSFHIEAKEECKFDFLEIRDGQYGFSNLIGRYCGTDFPPEITSKERYLWLHFHSDESIEYSGFTAVYEFIDRNKDAPSTDLNCTIHKDGYEGFVNSSDVPYDIRDIVIKNKIPLDCMWRIEVQLKWKIQVKFLDFKLSKPNDCETNFLDIFPEQTIMPLRIKNFCGSAGEGITSDSHVLHIRFFAEQIAINSTFAILFTAFRDRGSTGCNEDEYDCEDATCISNELLCNGRDNCKFRWDEEGCAIQSGGQSEHVIIIIIVFGLILGGMLITFIINCVRKIMRDQKIIREHIRQSKESKLDEVGRRVKVQPRELTPLPTSCSNKPESAIHNFPDISSKDYIKESNIVVAPKRKQDPIEFGTVPHNQNFSPKEGTKLCDMSCQTRESLFINHMGDSKLFNNSIQRNTQTSSPLSTFAREKHKNVSPDIADSFSETPKIPKSKIINTCHHQPEICNHHYHGHNKECMPLKDTHNQFQQSKILIPIQPTVINIIDEPNVSDTNNCKQCTRKSKDTIESRNSAPDVIIMTSN